MGGHWKVASMATIALLAAPAAAQGAVKAGAAEVDASWHVGASAGQYASDGTFVSDHGVDPNTHSVRRASSYGRQSELKVRAIVIEGADGKRMAIVKNDLYIPQDGLHRRTAQLLEAGSSGVTRETLTMAVTHNHSSPYYSSPSWGVWAFQDVFDVRFYDYYSKKQAEAVEKAAANLKPVRVGAAVGQFDKTHRHSFGPAIADDGSPAGYPQSDSEHDLVVVRFDDISDPANPKPLANLVNFPLHPEFLDGNDLISADYLGPLQRMVDRETGALTIWTQGSVGTAEPERSTYHSVHERLEFTHKEYAQAEYGARLMADAIGGLHDGIAGGSAGDPDRFVPFMTDFPVQMVDKWYPGPFSHPYPGVSNCRTDKTLSGEPQVPIIGLPDCASTGSLDDVGITPPEEIPENPIAGANPGLNTDAFQRAGIPVPENYSAPSYTGLEEDLNVHLQAFRLGDILFTVCSCEQWKDQGANIKTRTDKVQGNEHLGHDWSESCVKNNDGTYGGEPEGYGDGTWDCTHPSGPIDDLEDRLYQRMRAQVFNPANGWNDLENTATAESEPTDVREIKGNFTHDDDARSAQLGYRLTVAMGMGNDYNGYIASYREYQRGDHYRKALTAWGPHSSDYMATRLVTLGRLLKNPSEPLPTDQQQEQAVEALKVTADNAANDVRAQALGTVGASSIAAYEAALPDDGGDAEVVEQPADLERFREAKFTWNGGSNFTDSPDVTVERKVRDGWEKYADGSGEVPLTLKFPQPEEIPAHEMGDQRWEWTAHFEAFVSRFDLGDRPRATPAGTYRFVAKGKRRDGGTAVDYTLTSREFEVKPWSGITVDDLREDTGGTVSFKLGPRRTLQVTGGGGPDIEDEIGPIDYPDTYDSDVRFIDDVRTFLRDPAAADDPDQIEWFCLHCSFRPWADDGDGQTVQLAFVNGSSSRTVEAHREGDRWVSDSALAAGEIAYVPSGCARDAYGNFNGAASAWAGATPGGPLTATCAVAPPSDPDPDPDPNPGRGTGTGTGSGQGGNGRTPSARRGGSSCARPNGALSDTTLGAVALGRSRAVNRRAFTFLRSSRASVDRFCLSDGRHVRVGYPTRGLLRTLSARTRRSVRGRAIFATTSSRAYSAFGVSPGDALPRLRARRFRVGRDDWYLVRGRSATVLFKVRRGKVDEVGVGDRRLTRGRAATKRYLRSFS